VAPGAGRSARCPTSISAARSPPCATCARRCSHTQRPCPGERPSAWTGPWVASTAAVGVAKRGAFPASSPDIAGVRCRGRIGRAGNATPISGNCGCRAPVRSAWSPSSAARLAQGHHGVTRRQALVVSIGCVDVPAQPLPPPAARWGSISGVANQLATSDGELVTEGRCPQTEPPPGVRLRPHRPRGPGHLEHGPPPPSGLRRKPWVLPGQRQSQIGSQPFDLRCGVGTAPGVAGVQRRTKQKKRGAK
jgi:hypothetical protein